MEGVVTVDEGGRSVLGRGLAILESFRDDDDWLKLREIGERAGLPKSTTHRLCLTLTRIGYLESAKGRFRPTDKVFFLSGRASWLRRMTDLTLPLTYDLSRRTGQAAHVGVLRQNSVFHVQLIPELNPLIASDSLSQPLPVHCTSGGKVILANAGSEKIEDAVEAGLAPYTRYSIVRPQSLRDHLSRIVDEGVAFCDQEYRLGFRAVAAPIFAGDRVVAELSVSGTRPMKLYRSLENELKSLASHISASLIGDGNQLPGLGTP